MNFLCKIQVIKILFSIFFSWSISLNEMNSNKIIFFFGPLKIGNLIFLPLVLSIQPFPPSYFSIFWNPSLNSHGSLFAAAASPTFASKCPLNPLKNPRFFHTSIHEFEKNPPEINPILLPNRTPHYICLLRRPTPTLAVADPESASSGSWSSQIDNFSSFEPISRFNSM